jgi:molybdopterin-guanine dinucleotide biosynthesis protein A
MRAIIPCAGKSSRFNGENKSLVTIDHMTVIERMVIGLKQHCDKITIIINSSSKERFEQILNKHSEVSFYIDDTYTGNGGAIKNVLIDKGEEYFKDDLFITWGDIVFLENTFIKDFIQQSIVSPGNVMYIAVQWEKNPYLAILLDENKVPQDVFYSKEEGYRLEYGYHDLAAYILKKEAISHIMDIPSSKIGEIRFLDIVNVLYKADKGVKIIEFFNNPMLSFNNVDELNKLLSVFYKK